MNSIIKLSVVVLTKNEEKNIIDCLETLDFCNDIIIVDDNSTDRTIELIEQYKINNKNIYVFKRELNTDFSAQRKYGIEKATNNWILFVDADERIDSGLSEEIMENLEYNSDYGGFLIPRVDYMWGKELKHGETGKIKLLRLFNKTKGSLKGKVHETWETKSKVGTIISPIRHYPHPTVNEFLKEINFYSDLRARELYEDGKKTNFISIILYTNGKFIKNYIFKRGFNDGTEGFVHAALMSFNSFMVRGKLWLLWQRKQAS